MYKRAVSQLISLILFSSACFAQQEQIDSLKRVLSSAPDDTLKVNIYFAVCKKYFSTSPDEAIAYARKGKELSEKLLYPKGVGYAYKNVGLGYYWKGNYIDAIHSYHQALAVFDSINDKVGVANIQSNLGAIYFNQSDDEQALEYYLKSLKTSEEVNDTFRILQVCINIGVVYANKPKTYDKALEYYYRALPLSEALNDKDAIGMTAVNMGEIYFKKSQDSLALKYFERSLRAFENSENIPYSLNYIGKVYLKRKEYQMALEYHQRAYDFAGKSGARLDMAQSLLGIAGAEQKMGETVKAISTYKQVEGLARDLSAIQELKESFEGLSLAYAARSDFSNAFKYQSLLIAIKDTLYNIDTDKKLQGLQFNFDLEKKESKINLLTKDNEIQQHVIGRQKLVRNGFIGGFAIMVLFAGVFLRQRIRISKEKHRSDELLLNILPEEVAEELKQKGSAEAKQMDDVTVLFTDFKGFTMMSEKLTPRELVKDIHECFSAFDHIMDKYGIEKIKTIGDSYMAAGGLPIANKTHPTDVVNAALEICRFIEDGKARKIAMNAPYFEIRIGIHTGPVVAGIVGVKKFAYDIWGDTVNTASRLESSGEVGRVNISGTTFNLIKDKFHCTHRGRIQAKNKGEIDMYFVEGSLI